MYIHVEDIFGSLCEGAPTYAGCFPLHMARHAAIYPFHLWRRRTRLCINPSRYGRFMVEGIRVALVCIQSILCHPSWSLRQSW